MITHSKVTVGGARLHVARTGTGRPLLLLHGWPEFWKTWEPVMTRLADRFELIAPDLRGFGKSDKPTDTFGPSEQAGDMSALIEALGVGRVGIVSHDVGATVTQVLARRSPDRLAGLFFLNFMYPGIGSRFTAPDHVQNVWHMYFNQTDLAPKLVGASPDGVRLFITYFLKHWSYRNDAFTAQVVDDFVANFEEPGNLEGGFQHYRAVAEQRKTEMSENAPDPVPIDLPTCVRWADHDPTFDPAWTDRLPEFFSNLDFAPFPGVGHFPHREDPDRAAHEIANFFDRLDPKHWKA